MRYSFSGRLFWAPNLILFLCCSGQIFSEKTLFDEAYLSRDAQIWVHYSEQKGEGRFKGLWASRKDQIKVSGVRRGDRFLFQSEGRQWSGVLRRRGTRCRVMLEVFELTARGHREQKSLVASYC